jgi:hypothetical protein
MTDVDKAVELYRKLRDIKEAIEHEADAKVAGVKAKMLKLEAWLDERAKLDNVTGFNTAHGTVYWKLTPFCTVADWGQAFPYIRDNNRWDLLVHGVSKDAVTAEIKLTGRVPPGLNYGTRRSMQINKPTVKE